MRTLIITDSNCDLSYEYLQENNIPVIPFYFHLKGKCYEDNFGGSMGYQEFYDELRGGEMPTTAQITPFVFEEYFRKYLTEGYSIIYIGFSSALSESYSHSVLAKKTILNEESTANITVIDTRSATVGQGLLVYHACEMLKQGKSKQEIVNWIEDNKLKVNIWFTVDSLDHLRRGGRLSAASAAVGTLLDVKPLLFVDSNGKLVPVKKVRGRKKAIKGLLEEFQDRVINAEEQTIFISHGDCIEDAEYLKKIVMNEGKAKNAVINYVGPVIGAHTGPGILCIAYIGISR
jgi:DegV family protein with EDD domain